MKHLYLFLFLLFSTSLLGQKIDCTIPNKSLKASDNFEKITEVYSQYLEQMVGSMQDKTLTPKAIQNLNVLGACYFKKIKNTKNGLLYAIPEDMSADEPSLILFLLTSKAIDTPEDRQSWFNLYPIVNATQKSKLWNILWRERVKLAETIANYGAKRLTVKEAYLKKWKGIGEKYDNKFDQKIFGICTSFPSQDNKPLYGVWEKSGDSYVLDGSGDTCNSNVNQGLKNR